MRSTSITDRLEVMRESFSQKLKPDWLQTIKDWNRRTGNFIYFNNQQAFSYEDQNKPDSAKIFSTVIINKLRRTDPLITEYIKHHGHQDGFLNISESTTKFLMLSKGKHIDSSPIKRFDFIENSDGSITYIERCYIDGYRIIGVDDGSVSDPYQSGRPLAIVVTTSNIKIENNEVIQELVDDKIWLVDKLGENLFNKNDGTLVERYESSIEEIEAELNNAIVLRILNKIDRKITQLSNLFNPALAKEVLEDVIGSNLENSSLSIDWLKSIVDQIILIIHSQTSDTLNEEITQAKQQHNNKSPFTEEDEKNVRSRYQFTKKANKIVQSNHFQSIINLQEKIKEIAQNKQQRNEDTSFFKRHPWAKDVLYGAVIGSLAFGALVAVSAIVTLSVVTSGAFPMLLGAGVMIGTTLGLSGTLATVIGLATVGTGCTAAFSLIAGCVGVITRKFLSGKEKSEKKELILIKEEKNVEEKKPQPFKNKTGISSAEVNIKNKEEENENYSDNDPVQYRKQQSGSAVSVTTVSVFKNKPTKYTAPQNIVTYRQKIT